MKLSVVIPAHNGEKYLSACIESVLNQVRTPDEIIVVDDASIDNTSLITNSDDYCGRVKYYFNNEPMGFVDAWNRAIGYSTGDYVTILHQDDLLAYDYLFHVERALKRYPHVLHVYSACDYIDSSGKEIKSPLGPHSIDPVLFSGRQYARNYLRGVATNSHIHRCPGVTTSRELLLNKCTYRKEAGHIADDDFFLRVGAFTDVVGIAAPLASYRNHSDSETGRLDLMSLCLARDYVFQADYHRSGETLLDTDGVAIIDSLAVRFINLLLFQGCTERRDDWINEALRLSELHQAMAPGILKSNLPLWARPLWLMAQSSVTRRVAGWYSSMLKTAHSAISVRKGPYS